MFPTLVNALDIADVRVWMICTNDARCL